MFIRELQTLELNQISGGYDLIISLEGATKTAVMAANVGTWIGEMIAPPLTSLQLIPDPALFVKACKEKAGIIGFGVGFVVYKVMPG